MAAYPDWVMKYKKKGTYVNKVGDKYYLYAAHSERIKGTNKIRRVSDGYLGRITQHDGLIPPKHKITGSITTYEFGISFATICCSSDILSGLRRSFKMQGDIIYSCSILLFIYGMYSRELFESSYLCIHFASAKYPDVFTSAQLLGIDRGHRMILDSVSRCWGSDFALAKAFFSDIRLIKIGQKLYLPEISPATKALSEKYSIDWSSASWQR